MENYEVKEPKNNAALLVLLAIFITLSMILGGYIVYDKIIKEEPKQEEKESEDKDKESNDDVLINENPSSNNTLTDISKYPKQNDEGIINYMLLDVLFDDDTNDGFENLTVEMSEIDFEFKCSSYMDDTGNESTECSVIDMYLNNKKLASLNYGYDGTEMIVTDKYIIVQSGIAGIFGGEITIFDKTGTEIKKVEKTTKGYTKEVSTEMTETSIKVVEDKLYYVTYESFEEGTTTNLEFKYLDLKDNLKEYSIEKFSGIINDQA